MSPARRVRIFGDSAVVVEVDSLEEAHGLAAALSVGLEAVGLEAGRDEDGVVDVIVGDRSVTVVIEPSVTSVAVLAATLAALPALAEDRTNTRLVEIPVALDGPDLDEVAQLTGLSPSAVAALLGGTELTVAFVGFAPGFAYLVGLPAELAAVARRSTPRAAVPGGSLALAGGFAGIYPQASPGGWQLIGRTDVDLFDPTTAPYSLLRAGDRVRLNPSDLPAPRPAPTTRRTPLRSAAERTVLVENPGLLSFVQDLGRNGVAALGVPRAGAADPYALRTANRMVGNAEGDAAIETTARGPTLRFGSDAHVAVVGTAAVQLDGHRLPEGPVFPVAAGQQLTITDETSGLRSYIAVTGGIEIPLLLGSRASDVLSRLGLGPLVTGDILGLGPPGRPGGRAGAAAAPGSVGAAGTPIRVMVGPDPFPAEAVDRLVGTSWAVDPSSDRIGVRLRATPAPTVPAVAVLSPAVTSRGMVTGAIQLPPDGQPIVLLNDHATVGGYPVIASVVSADLGRLGQLRPGDPVAFAAVDLEEATRAREQREQSVRDAVVGWYPVRTD